MKHAEMLKLMGRMVLVSRILERQKGNVYLHDKSLKEIVKRVAWDGKSLENPRTGWVVGFRHVQEGYVEPESHGHGFSEDSYEPAEWKTEKVIPCLLVAFWPTEKPVHVPMDGYVLLLGREQRTYIKNHKFQRAPEPYTTAGGWKEHPEYRESNAEFMKDEMKNWPRDEKGRWRKKP